MKKEYLEPQMTEMMIAPTITMQFISGGPNEDFNMAPPQLPKRP